MIEGKINCFFSKKSYIFIDHKIPTAVVACFPYRTSCLGLTLASPFDNHKAHLEQAN